MRQRAGKRLLAWTLAVLMAFGSVDLVSAQEGSAREDSVQEGSAREEAAQEEFVADVAELTASSDGLDAASSDTMRGNTDVMAAADTGAEAAEYPQGFPKDNVSAFTFTNIDGGTVDNQAAGRPKLLIFAPVNGSMGMRLFRGIYAERGIELLYDGRYMDTVIFDTSKSSADALKEALEAYRRDNLADAVASADQIQYCCDTAAEDNQIKKLMDSYCSQTELWKNLNLNPDTINMDNQLVYFLLDGKNQIVKGYSFDINQNLSVHFDNWVCGWKSDHLINFTCDLEAPADLTIESRTEEYIKLSFTVDTAKLPEELAYYRVDYRIGGMDWTTDDSDFIVGLKDTYTLDGVTGNCLENGKMTMLVQLDSLYHGMGQAARNGALRLRVTPMDRSGVDSVHTGNLVLSYGLERETPAQPPVDNLPEYRFDTVSGQETNNQAVNYGYSERKLMMFFPVVDSTGSSQTLAELYRYENRWLGESATIMILDTAGSSAEDIEAQEKQMSNDWNDAVYCYDTAVEDNRIREALTDYCRYLGIEMDLEKGYYFLVDENGIIGYGAEKMDSFGAVCIGKMEELIKPQSSLEAPTDLQVKANADEYVELKWTWVGQEDSYRVEYSVFGGDWFPGVEATKEVGYESDGQWVFGIRKERSDEEWTAAWETDDIRFRVRPMDGGLLSVNVSNEVDLSKVSRGFGVNPAAEPGHEETLLDAVAENLEPHVFDTIDGGKVDNQAEGKPKALVFFPVADNPGTLDWTYWQVGWYAYDGTFVDTVILDTGKSGAGELAALRAAAKDMGNNLTLDGDRMQYVYDTAGSGNRIWKLLEDYCGLVGLEAEQEQAYYFLLDHENRLVAYGSSKRDNVAQQKDAMTGIIGECIDFMSNNGMDTGYYKAPTDLRIEMNTEDCVKLVWTNEAAVGNYAVYYYIDNGTGWRPLNTDVTEGFVGTIYGETYSYFEEDSDRVTFWIPKNQLDWIPWQEEGSVRFCVRPESASIYFSNVVELAATPRTEDPNAYAKAELVDDAGDVLDEIVLHEGESLHLNSRLVRNSGEIVHQNDFPLGWSIYEQWGETLRPWDGEECFRYYRSAIYDRSNTYIQGVKATGDVKLYLHATFYPRDAKPYSDSTANTLFLEDLYIPVTVLPGETGADYQDYETMPLDVCGSLEELSQLVREKLAAREPSFVGCMNKGKAASDSTQDMLAWQSYWPWKEGWSLYDDVYHIYDDQKDAKPWEGDYLYYNVYETMSDQYRYGEIDYTITYQGETYSIFDMSVKYYLSDGGNGAKEKEQYVSQRIDALVHQPTGALYKYRNSTDKEKADACTDWVHKNVSYIGTEELYYHTAYAALYGGKATCEGYSTLLYRILKELGVTNRVIGTKLPDNGGNAHGFNLVMLGGRWYYYDPTSGKKCQYEGQFGYTADDWQTLPGGHSQKFKENITDKLATEPYDGKEPDKPLVDSKLQVTLAEPGGIYTYTGSAIKPEVIVTNNGVELTEGVDYTVKYSNNVKASYDGDGKPVAENKRPKITITGRGNLSGSTSATFLIEPKNIAEVKTDDFLYVAEGAKAAPVLIYNNMKLGNRDYYLDEPGKKYAVGDDGSNLTIYGKPGGNYTGSLSIPVKVVKKADFKKFTITLDSEKLYYNGSKQVPGFTVKESGKDGKVLGEGDFFVVYPGGVSREALDSGAVRLDAGTVKITFVGRGLYTGSVTKTYKINPLAVKEEGGMTVAGVEDAVFNNIGVTQRNLTVTYHEGKADRQVLRPGKDYKVTYSNNKKVSTDRSMAKCKITFLGNFKGSKAVTKQFRIGAASLNDSTEGLKIVVPDKVYGGKANVYKSAPIVTINNVALKKSDYTVSYYLDQAMEKPVGSKKGQYKVELAETDPFATVYVKIEGKGSYGAPAGTDGAGGTGNAYATAQYRVYRKSGGQRDLSKAKITLYNTRGKKDSKVQYTGLETRPARLEVTYKNGGQTEHLAENVDYTVEYVNNVNKGKATIVITAMGDTYVGSKTATYSIVSQNLGGLTGLLADLFG